MKFKELFSKDDNNKVKVFIKNKYNEFLNLEMNTYNITVLVISIILVSAITTPFLGIPLGILAGMYIIESKRRNKETTHFIVIFLLKLKNIRYYSVMIILTEFLLALNNDFCYDSLDILIFLFLSYVQQITILIISV